MASFHRPRPDFICLRKPPPLPAQHSRFAVTPAVTPKTEKREILYSCGFACCIKVTPAPNPKGLEHLQTLFLCANFNVARYLVFALRAHPVPLRRNAPFPGSPGLRRQKSCAATDKISRDSINGTQGEDPCERPSASVPVPGDRQASSHSQAPIPTIWFASWRQLAGVLSDENRALLRLNAPLRTGPRVALQEHHRDPACPR
jgi:hypothetical protein